MDWIPNQVGDDKVLSFRTWCGIQKVFIFLIQEKRIYYMFKLVKIKKKGKTLDSLIVDFKNYRKWKWQRSKHWIPAFAGMTKKGVGDDKLLDPR